MIQLLDQADRFRIRKLTVGWTSQMESMWATRCFPNLEGIVCVSPVMRDLRELVGLDDLRSLSITSDERPARSLDVLRYLKLDRLVVDTWRKSDTEKLGRCPGPLAFLWLGCWPRAPPA